MGACYGAWAEFLILIVDDMSLLQRIDSSDYLSGLLERHADLAVYASAAKCVDVPLLRSVIKALSDCADGQGAETVQRSAQLRIHKQRFSLLWSIADLSGSIDFAMLGQLQSEFAARSIDAALDIALHSQKISKLFARGETLTPQSVGIFILGLGKLGGRDLNFSSDVDLIAFYDKESLKIAPMMGASHVVTECLKSLTKILSEQTEHGFVWRVDWRLRPHASLRNLSMLSEKALDFYHYQAQPWHRLAMIKARPVAGNMRLAQVFLSDLNSFMWRSSLDFRAIDDIATLKEKINLEHPALATQRAQQGIMLEQGQGMNLKLGNGGIREIEFIVNAMQMLWGGRKPALRISNTMAALAVLVEEGLMQGDDAVALTAAYKFLRRAENRLQMQDNAQLYYVPDSEPALSAFLLRCGAGDWAAFNHTLSQHRQQVQRLFKQFFKTELASQDESEITSGVHLEGLTDAAQDVMLAWESGFRCYGLAHDQLAQFQPLLYALLQEIQHSGRNASEAVLQIDDYFRRLPPGGQYFRLLKDFPWLLEKIIAPLLLSPSMTSLLQQSPHIIDRFLEQTESDALDTTIVFSTSDYESRLENLRRLANEELYLRFSHFFESQLGPVAFQQQLTGLAESLLQAAIRVACEEMGLAESPIAVIGFGKLGAQGMMPKSDLDLVYLCDTMQSHALASKCASRLNTVINTPMREGRVYELDTRLRPSGQSGSVTISLTSYEQHQFERAFSWSHLAMVPARFVAGNAQVGEKFAKIKRAVLSRPRNIRQFKHDCAKMLQRVQQQKIVAAEPDQFIAKNRPGGLFELEYLVYCQSVLAAVAQPDIGSMEFQALLETLEQAHPGLCEAYDVLRRLQLEIRLFGHDGEHFNKLPAPVIEHVLRVMNCTDIPALIDNLAGATNFVTIMRDAFFHGIKWKRLSGWKEEPVEWL